MKSRTVTGKRVTLGAAGAGVVAGAVGLAVLAAPAGAGPAPSLPNVSPQALVKSVMTANPPAFGGTVRVDNELGLPTVPAMGSSGMSQGGLAALGNGTTTAHVYTDGAGKVRITHATGNAGETLVEDGSTVWLYDSSDRSVEKFPIPKQGVARMKQQHETAMDPAIAARQLVDTMRTSSTVSVNGTASVAGRDAYELVLTPKPSEHTLVRQVRVAIDGKTRMPLRLDVYGDGSPDPVLRVGFTSLDVGKQDPSLFTFTPPQDAKVTTHAHPKAQAPNPAKAEPKVTGNGWDTVVTAKLDPKALAGGHGNQAGDPMKLLSRFGKHVSGPWGDGYLVHAKIGNALITSDGRIAAGLVPQQELVKALGTR